MKPVLWKKIIWKTAAFDIQTSGVFISTWDESFTFLRYPCIAVYWADSRGCGNGCVLQRGWGWTWRSAGTKGGRGLGESERLWQCVCGCVLNWELCGEIWQRSHRTWQRWENQNKSAHCGVVFMLLKSKASSLEVIMVTFFLVREWGNG